VSLQDVSLPSATFRAALGRFATGVTVVSTVSDGIDYAMTANAVTSVSLDPPMVLVCVYQDARFHDAVLASGEWGVSILAADARPSAVWLATHGRPLAGQLDPVPHHRGPVTGVALVDGSLATLECRTVATHPAGDHTVVIGEVVAIDLPDHASDALTYYRGQYGRIPS
jgi:flavin reductase (DIM6/NTAB) family NADH-FMN oxidoreductase RutF